MLIFAPTGAGRSFGTAAQYDSFFRPAGRGAFFCTAEQYTGFYSAPPRRGEGDGGFAPGATDFWHSPKVSKRLLRCPLRRALAPAGGTALIRSPLRTPSRALLR